MSELRPDDAEIELEAVQLGAFAGVGRVVRAGPQAEALLGARVLVGAVDACGECEVCRRGGAPVCPSARRREASDEARVVATARWLIPLTESLSVPLPGAAAVAGDVALAYTLYARTGVGPRDAVVVCGESHVARFLVEVLLAKGIAPVVAGAALGAWATRRGAIAAPDRASIEAHFAAQGMPNRPWRLIATADRAALAASLAGPRATLTLAAPVPALPGDLVAREVTIIGVAGPHPDLVVEAAALCVRGDVDLGAALVREL